MNGLLRCDSHRNGFGKVICFGVDLSIMEVILDKCDDNEVRSVSFFSYLLHAQL